MPRHPPVAKCIRKKKEKTYNNNEPRKKICTINDIKVTLDGKPVSTKNSFFSHQSQYNLVVLTCTSRFAPWEVVKASLKQPMTTQG